MTISSVDILIILIYLIIVAGIGSFSGGKQRSTRDYFMGGKDIPWWAVSFSIVAAETSSLTFISIPGLAYLTNLNFLQLTIGYLIARILIALFFLPAYHAGDLETAYNFLENRFGTVMRRYASIVFLFTRIAADGVRLFSTAIPLAIIFRTIPFFSSLSGYEIYILAILIIAVVSFIYTFTGGIKGVIWADVLQMAIYLGGALTAVILLSREIQLTGVWSALGSKTEIFNMDFGDSLSGFFSKPYTLIGSILGGIFLSLASHGTDQLIVQRLLTTRSLRDSQKAIIGSGIMVIIQFALFMIVGLLLYLFFHGISIHDPVSPFHRADEIFPYYILHYLPEGVKGLIIAGLFAAAISTLAGSMTSLSASAMLDLYRPVFGKRSDGKHDVRISRIFTVIAAVILIFVAFLFIQVQQSVVEIALGIASVTYGGLLGVFLLGLFDKKTGAASAFAGMTAGLLVMLFIIIIPRITETHELVHWTWYVAIGTMVTVISGKLSEFLMPQRSK
jgi:SSS family solute:Na+ symporter